MNRIQNHIYIVTGASSGIGEDIARTLADLGATVYAASRRTASDYVAKAGRFIPIHIDVTQDASVSEAVCRVLSAEHRIDGLINCAGCGLAGALEDTTAEEALHQIDVNAIGALRMTNAVLPAMREARSGIIINIGSIGGDFALPFQGTYSMAKAALRKETEIIRLETAEYGIQACVIEPGDLKTGFTDARIYSSKTAGSIYEEAARKAVAQMAHDEQTGLGPACVTGKVLKLLKKKKLPACVAVGGYYVVFPFLNRILPYRLVEFILRKMYMPK